MRQQESRDRAPSSPLSTLLVAWVVVVGMTFAPVGTYFYQTGDLRLLIAFLGAAFLIGAALFVAMGLARMGARDARSETGEIANLNKRGAIFGKR